jgi:aldose 1-epimerase
MGGGRYGGLVTDTAAPSGRQFAISAAGHRAVVVEVGGGIREYGTEQRPVLAGFAESAMQPHSAGAVLVPWPNRIAGGRYVHDGATQQLGLSEPARGNAIHGLARWIRWTLVEQTADSVELACDLPPQTGYPFRIQTSVRWSVGLDGLRADHRARNVGALPAPFGLGTHPYLHLGNATVRQTRLQLPATSRLLTDENSIPAGSQPVADTSYDLRTGRELGDLQLDTCFADLTRDGAGIATARVSTPDGATTEVWADASFDYLQAYTVSGFAPGVDAVAIEPMSCAPNAFNSGAGVVLLAPGEDWSGSWGIRAA